MSPAVGGRRDDSARTAIEDAAAEYGDDAGIQRTHSDPAWNRAVLDATDHAPAEGDQPAIQLGPDCAAGKHSACVGEGWDPVDEVPVDCPCTCHGPQGWGVAR